jgi:hypothetical protein
MKPTVSFIMDFATGRELAATSGAMDLVDARATSFIINLSIMSIDTFIQSANRIKYELWPFG